MRYYKFVGLIAILVTAGRAPAQEPSACAVRADLSSDLLSDARRSLWHALSATQTPYRSDFLRSSSMRREVCVDSAAFLGDWYAQTAPKRLDVLPVAASVVSNSAYPRSINDGAAWQGAGFTTGITAGVRGTYRFINWQLAPELYYQQNKDFEFVQNTLAGYSPYANPYHAGIDYPTRLGGKGFSTFAPGQSFVQATYRKWSVTAGTENLWMGAAQIYPILMSYTAPGFPHVRIGTQRALRLPVVDVEFQTIFASLHESDYFDQKPGNDSHFYGTTMLIVSPHILKGLSLGVARAVHDTASVKGKGPSFYTSRVFSSPFGGDAHSGNLTETNALGLLFGRWVLPESKFEAYAEWSREDTPGGFLDLLREPDWTQAYVVGFQKAYITRSRLWRVYGELNHLGESAPSRAGRGNFSYYTHSRVRQGHTNEGQLLGAAIGSGSDVQRVGADIFDGRSRTGFFIERTRYDDDVYYQRFARRWGETRHDAEITLSGTRTQMFGPLEVAGGLTMSRRYGRMFLTLNTTGVDLVETNWNVSLYGRWRPTF